MSPEPYRPLRASQVQMLRLRGARIAVRRWGRLDVAPILLLHGWMDCAASYQFLADCLPQEWPLAAIDWRGYGLSDNRADLYWLPDNFADLEAVLDELMGGAPARIIGHSLGGTVASMYAGVRPQRVAWLVNIEGFGLWRSEVSPAARLARWLDAQRELPAPRRYDSLDELAARILRRHTRLRPERARYLAAAWSRQSEHGYEIAADPKHQLIQPLRYRAEDIDECWSRIRCPVLMLHGSESDFLVRAGGAAALEHWRSLIASLRVAVVPGAGHMVQHEQPEAAAAEIMRFAREFE